MNGLPATPDLLVLGSGGVLGDVWMTGLMVGLDRGETVDLQSAGGFVGTSAGSIVATRIAARQDLEELIRKHMEVAGPPASTAPPGSLEDGSGFLAGRLADLLMFHGRAGRSVRRTLLRRLPVGRKELSYLARDMQELAPDWPERLHITAVNSRTGGRVVFARGRTHGLTVSEAVQASCAIPTVFRPVEGADGAFVDGGVWSPSNVDAVPAKPGQTVVCLTPTGSDQGAVGFRRRSSARFFRAIVDGEVARLRRRGVRVVNVVPDVAASAAIGPSRMASGREAEVYEAGLAQGLHLAGPLGAWLRPGAREDAALSR
ncbi:MAG: patatin-like phospholipase family protein [Solirubrobacterales bacterium]|nr:patatin-like phospholipase family protein [Solirubrobacterales bacterium]